MRVSVIVPTYNAPRELDLVLAGLSRQTTPPHEVVVADDGSTDETRRLLDGWRARLAFPLHHAWQVDKGFRKARIVNEAVRRSSGDHLLFLDGDSIPHSRWLDDHRQAADGRRVLCGRRVKLGPALSRTVTTAMVLAGDLERWLGPVPRSALKGDTHRFLLGVRLPMPIARLFHPKSRKLMGVNFSLPRSAYAAVNGYDEEWTGYGAEDRDLELRLRAAGYPLYPLLSRAVVYHLDHPLREAPDEVRRKLAALEDSPRTRCAVGLDSGEAFDPRT